MNQNKKKNKLKKKETNDEKPQPATTGAPKLSRHMRQILFKVKSHARKQKKKKRCDIGM